VCALFVFSLVFVKLVCRCELGLRRIFLSLCFVFIYLWIVRVCICRCGRCVVLRVCVFDYLFLCISVCCAFVLCGEIDCVWVKFVCVCKYVFLCVCGV